MAQGLEEKFSALCSAYNALVVRVNAMERKQKLLAENCDRDASNFTDLVFKLTQYGYLSKPNANIPIPKMRASGCKLIPFDGGENPRGA